MLTRTPHAILLAIVLLLSDTTYLHASSDAERPNIIVLLADDLGYSDIGCYGSDIRTPNLDRLAKGGVRFSHFYNTGRCCPSRASLLTGLYPHQADVGHMLGDLGVRGYRDRLSFDAVTIAEVLGAADYHTIMTGKWHLGWRDEGSPTARGFERFYGTRGFIDSYFTIVPLTEMYLNDEIVLKVGENPVNHLAPDEEWYTTDVFTDYALHFIDEVRKENRDPFFLYLAYNAPHFPLHAKPEDLRKYRGRYRDGWTKSRQRRYARLSELGLLDDSWPLSPLDVPEWDSLTAKQRDDLDFKMALFAAIVDRLDQNVGRVIRHLEKIGELDNTLLVFLSDNGGTKETGLFGIKGEANTVDNYERWGRKGGWTSSYGQGWANLSNVPFRRYKRENHEGGISAPLIVHWPSGIKSGGEIRHQVAHLIDLMPTFVEVAGAKYPQELHGRSIQPMEGRSLTPFFDSAATQPRTLFWEHEGNRAIRDGDWKLVGLRNQPWELYNIAKDRTELDNLTAQHPERREKLKSAWNAWAGKVGVVTPAQFDGSRKKHLTKRNEARAEIRSGLKAHDRALFVKDGWIRDPYIILGPDDYFYLTGTTPLPGDPRARTDPYNTGLGPASLVGWKTRAWRSRDLIVWETLGAPFDLKDGVWFKSSPERFEKVSRERWRLWAPELHWLGERWALVHTSPSPVRGANLSLTSGLEVAGPWLNPMGSKIARRHDPSLFRDDDGTLWLIWGATKIAPLKPDFSDLAGKPVTIGPSGETAKMGHEGCLIREIHGKYVLFGTGWSTGRMRHGSYNLYYAVADKITGPYSERKFAGRFLGHGTPFQDKNRRWWCTAFFNANVPPLPKDGIESRDLRETAQTINEQGVTIVPLDVRTLDDGEIFIRAKDPRYANPGPDEAQKFRDAAPATSATDTR